MALFKKKGKTFPVMTTYPEYPRFAKRWSVCREVIEGEDIVKEKGEKYLPMASHKSKEIQKMRYEAFKMRTPFIPFTYMAYQVQHAMVFRRTPTLVCPDDFLNSGRLDNVDGKGNSLYQFCSSSFDDLLKTGFGGVLLDMPEAKPGMSVYEAEKEGIKPYLTYYPAESIINIIFDNTKGVSKLKLVVLREKMDVYSDEFVLINRERYRVLSINKDGFYEQRVFTPVYDDDDNITDMTVSVVPVSIRGEQIDYIPFVLLPSDSAEKPPLYDLAMMNIHHYQVMADYYNGLHKVTMPTGYITGYTPKTDEDGNEDEIVLGDDVFVTEENPDAKFGVLSYAGEGMQHTKEGIDKIESLIAGIFMKSIAPDKKTSETAEAAYVHRSGENARLATFSRNVSEKLSQIIEWYEEWCGFEGAVEIHLNYDYETMALDPNIINSIANISGQGKFPLYCVYYILKQQELIDPDMSFDDYIFLIDQEQLSGASAQEIYEAFKKRINERDNKLKGGVMKNEKKAK